MAMYGWKEASAGTRATAIPLCQDAYEQGNELCTDTLACYLYPCFPLGFGFLGGILTNEKDAFLHSCASVGFVIHGCGVILSFCL